VEDLVEAAWKYRQSQSQKTSSQKVVCYYWMVGREFLFCFGHQIGFQPIHRRPKRKSRWRGILCVFMPSTRQGIKTTRFRNRLTGAQDIAASETKPSSHLNLGIILMGGNGFGVYLHPSFPFSGLHNYTQIYTHSRSVSLDIFSL
jgi:hypothetical protein